MVTRSNRKSNHSNDSESTTACGQPSSRKLSSVPALDITVHPTALTQSVMELTNRLVTHKYSLNTSLAALESGELGMRRKSPTDEF
jgi:hypothetical protein